MSERFRQILSTMLTGMLGGVIALVVLALLALGPLKASGLDLAASTATLPPCLRPQPPTPAECASNEKQLGLALEEYVQDYDDKYPSGTQAVGEVPNQAVHGVGWGGATFGYLRDASIYHCPFDKTTATKPVVALSYALNSNLAGASAYANTTPSVTVLLFETGGDPVSLTQYDEGAAMGTTVFSAAGDGTDGHLLAGPGSTIAPGVYYATGYLGGRPPFSSGSQFVSATARDDGGTNVTAADGHVVYVHPSSVSSGSNAATPSDPQTGGTNGTAAGTNALSGNGYQFTFSLI